MNKYRVFTRTWWKNNKDWPDGLEPGAGKKKTLGYVETLAEAQAMCHEYNSTHEPGRLSKKAEFESC